MTNPNNAYQQDRYIGPLNPGDVINSEMSEEARSHILSRVAGMAVGATAVMGLSRFGNSQVTRLNTDGPGGEPRYRVEPIASSFGPQPRHEGSSAVPAPAEGVKPKQVSGAVQPPARRWESGVDDEFANPLKATGPVIGADYQPVPPPEAAKKTTAELDLGSNLLPAAPVKREAPSSRGSVSAPVVGARAAAQVAGAKVSSHPSPPPETIPAPEELPPPIPQAPRVEDLTFGGPVPGYRRPTIHE